jgi:hypothetical protein
MYSYDHDLAAFVAIGTGTVSEDGSVIVSDPGVGVIKAGWHCGGNPNPVGSAGTCPTCKKCQGTDCVADNSQVPPQNSPTDCKKEVCQGGAVTSQNDDTEQPTDECKECKNGAEANRTTAAAAFAANSATINRVAASASAVAALGSAYGLTWEETVDITISARCDGGKWTAEMTALRGNYSLQARLLAGQQEVTGPAGNTTQANFCQQVTELNCLGESPCGGHNWYMLAAVRAHEEVHATRFQPGLAAAAPGIETSVEGLSVPTAPGKTQAQAVAEIRALAGFAAAVSAARTAWVAQDDVLLAGDHAAGGPTQQAERAVVNPMIATICAHAKANGWGACAVCPP